uniref:Calpain catalytic domain-containing protein n=1 Tax=Macrostomum lignano TaxID=282301 RepID=A0A1I8FG67_9PLAT
MAQIQKQEKQQPQKQRTAATTTTNSSKQRSCCQLPTVGQWRKIYVDDSLPLDECGRCLLPMTARFLELWPALLTKALIKWPP